MERQRQRTLLEWVRDKVESFFAAVSTFVARALLGKNLFEEEYRKLSMQEEAKKMFDNAEKDKGEEVKNKEKAAKKKEQRGIRQAQIYEAAKMNTKSNSMASKANISSDKIDALNKAEEARAHAASGSMASKANLVKDFNERNNK